MCLMKLIKGKKKMKIEKKRLEKYNDGRGME